MFKNYLQQNKCIKGINLKNLFPDLTMFYCLARHHIKNKAESDFTKQEVYRLKKVMSVRKQLHTKYIKKYKYIDMV